MACTLRFTLATTLLCLSSAVPAVAQTIVTVPAGASLQAALDGAAPGSVIELAPGATFSGTFVVRGDRHHLTIRTGGSPSGLPGAGQRTHPGYAAALAKLKSTTTAAALTVAPGAAYITIENVQFLPSPQAMATVLSLGAADASQASADFAPRHIVVDRVLVDVPDGVGQLRGIALNSAHTHIVNSYLAGLKAAGFDAQAICGWNGPGPFVIENNYLEATGENIMFGGGDPATRDLVPTNVRIRWNHLIKPVKWRGLSWTVKNLFELKNAQDVLLEGNLLEYNWKAAQDGYSIVLTPRNQNGGAPNTVVQRVRIVNNWVRHVSSVFNVLGRDNNYPTLQTNDIEIRNNVFEDVSYQNWGGVGRLMQIEGTSNLRLINNTSLNTGTAILAYGNPSYGFVLENNVVNYGSYGIIGDKTAQGKDTIAKYFPGSVVLGNVMPNNTASWLYPSGNYYPATWADVGFVDFAGGNYRLGDTSPYVRAGTDGKPPGANVDAVLAAMVVVPPIPPAQPPLACTLSVSPTSLEIAAAGGVANLTVTASTSSCAWTTSSDQTWAAVAPVNGSGSAVVQVTVAANTATTSRSATLTVAGVAIPLTQAAAAAPVSCTFVVSPLSYAAPAGGGAVDISVTASAATCAWTAVASRTWVIASPAAGTGSGTVRLTVEANSAKNARNATVTLGGQKVAVSQPGAPKR